jgi:hypothetical protein
MAFSPDSGVIEFNSFGVPALVSARNDLLRLAPILLRHDLMLGENLLARLILLLLTRLVRGNLGGLRARDVVFLHVLLNLCAARA